MFYLISLISVQDSRIKKDTTRGISVSCDPFKVPRIYE
jgi:hypothetical protein